MKIGSKIKPRTAPTRRTTVHGKEYVFAPLEDKDGQTHYVAEVTNEQHAETLVGSGFFYIYGKENEKQPSLTRQPADTSSTSTSSNGGEGSGEAGQGSSTQPVILDGHDPEAVAAAVELLKGTIPDVGKAVAGHTLPVIRAALALENSQEAPRKGMVSLLEATLEGAKQAGVKG